MQVTDNGSKALTWEFIIILLGNNFLSFLSWHVISNISQNEEHLNFTKPVVCWCNITRQSDMGNNVFYSVKHRCYPACIRVLIWDDTGLAWHVSQKCTSVRTALVKIGLLWLSGTHIFALPCTYMKSKKARAAAGRTHRKEQTDWHWVWC